MLKIPSKIEYVIENLRKNGFEAYIVGGCVRDMLLGKTPDDYDVTTSAKSEEIMSLFEKTVPTGIKHGTVTVITENSPVEVTTFRTEGEYKDHRRPQTVKFVTNLKEDLSRRDFTVNALAFNTSTGLVDYFGGKHDIEYKILKAVGEPEKRFNEDALRILRLFRLASVLNFTFEIQTLNAALKYSHTLKNISGERIFTELYKGVSGENFSAFKPLIDCDGLSFLSIKNNPDYNLIKKLRNNRNLAFFTFLHLSDANFTFVFDYLKVSNNLKKYCYDMKEILNHPFPETKSEIKKALCSFSLEIFEDMLFYEKAKNNKTADKTLQLLNEIKNNNEPYQIKDLKINGNDLKTRGINGKTTGEILEKLRDIVIEYPQKNDKEILLCELNKIIGN